MIVLLFILGLIMGSFYTVIGLRRPRNESIVKPRSHCEVCNHILKWYELIPVFSWVIQKGKCRECHAKLSVVYPLIELLTACLFVLSYLLYGIEYEFFAMIIISSLLVIIFVSDFKYLVILDGPLFVSSILILLLKYFFFNGKTVFLSFISGIVLFGFMLVIRVVGDHVFKTESLGGGDIKLAGFFGFVLGIRLSFIALILGCFLAFPYAFYYVMAHKEREVPFGPFLITGLLIIFILQSLILNFIEILI